MSGAVLFIYSTHPRKEVSSWRSSFFSYSSYFRSCKLVLWITGPRSSRGQFSLSFRSLSLFCSASRSHMKTTTTASKIEPECSSERRCLRWPEKALHSALRSCSSSSFSLAASNHSANYNPIPNLFSSFFIGSAWSFVRKRTAISVGLYFPLSIRPLIFSATYFASASWEYILLQLTSGYTINMMFFQNWVNGRLFFRTLCNSNGPWKA